MRRVLVWVTHAIACLVAAISLGTAAVTPLYVFPHTAEPAHADLVVVLGPPAEWRIDKAMEFVDRGVADRIAISVPQNAKQGFMPSGLADECAKGYINDYPIVCFTADPFTTQGEARATREILERDGRDSVVVITYYPHVVRARLIFSRCLPTGVVFVSGGSMNINGWLNSFLYQSGAFVKALFVTNQC